MERVVWKSQNKTQLLWHYFPCKALRGIVSKELLPKVTFRKLSKFSQSEATLTYCKLQFNQKRQLIKSHAFPWSQALCPHVNAKALSKLKQHILMWTPL
jgi:hypothetical protein